MKSDSLARHEPILTALREAGFSVDEVSEHDRETVITVSKGDAGGPPEIPVKQAETKK